MTNLEALMRAVIDNPDEDTPRLLYADELQEMGQNDRAEFIRVQVELARLGTVAEPRPRLIPKEFGGMEVVWSGDRTGWERHNELCRRERELWYSAMWKEFDSPWGGAHWERMEWYERGFLTILGCTLDDFLKHAATMFSEHPITKVVLTDRRPAPRTVMGEPGTTRVFWTRAWDDFPDYPHHISAALFDSMDGGKRHGILNTKTIIYPTTEDATAALGKQCIDYGRRVRRPVAV